MGSFVGNPCDLALVRMQADKSAPPEQRRNYGNVFNAFRSIIKDEGVLSLWRGSVPTMLRAMALNCAMLVSYDTMKEIMTTKFGKDAKFKILFSASMTSAVCTSCASLPFDNVKTKLQN
jgi:solute carrier family 25 oxoglutarate transporter 11